MYALMEGILQIVWHQNIADFHRKIVSKDRLCTFMHLKGQILADSAEFILCFSKLVQLS